MQFGKMLVLLLLLVKACIAFPAENADVDGESSRKVIGSSVVTSVSVIMDTGNGTKAVFADAAGKPMSKPSSGSDLASPIDLLNPDRYEFYTFDDNGDLVKRLMTWDEIQGIIASGDGDGFSSETFTSQGFLQEKRVDDVVNNVHNVLKEEIQSHKDTGFDHSTLFDTPDVSETWNMILPAIFGNSGETIIPEKPIMHGTPDTIMIEPASSEPTTSAQAKEEMTTMDLDQKDTSSTPMFDRTSPKPEMAITKMEPSPATTTRKPITIQSVKPEIMTMFESTPIPYVQTDSATEMRSTTERFMPSSDSATKLPTNTVSQLTMKQNSSTTPLELRTEKPDSDQSVSASSFKYNISTTSELSPPKESSTMKYSSTTKYATKRPQFSRKPIISSTVRSISSTAKPITSVSSGSTSSMKPTISSPVTRRTTSKTTVIGTIQPITSSSESATKYNKIPAVNGTKIDSMTVDVSTKIQSAQTEPSFTETMETAISNTPIFIIRTIPAKMNETTTMTNTMLSSSDEITTEYIKDSLAESSNQTIQQTSQLMENIETNAMFSKDQTTNYPEITSTYGSLVTFFSVSDNKNTETEMASFKTTTQMEETTTIPSTTTRESMPETKEIPTTSIASDEYNNESTTTENAEEASTKNANSVTTEQVSDETTNFVAKISATEILDQLLLTPNIIHEINTQFAQHAPQTTIEFENTEKTETSTQTGTTAYTEQYSEATTTSMPTTTKFTEPSPTMRDETVIEAVEKLISQASNQIGASNINATNLKTVTNMVNNSANKTMLQLQVEVATLASSMLNPPDNDLTTSRTNIMDEDVIADSVESILSQVFGSDQPRLTTIDDYITTTESYFRTEAATSISDRKYETQTTRDLSTTPLTTITTQFPETSTHSEEFSTFTITTPSTERETEYQTSAGFSTETTNQFITETSTAQYKSQEDSVASNSETSTQTIATTTTGYEPHIINITIIRTEQMKNLTKPAKSDTSLEVDYENLEMAKNVSALFNIANKFNSEVLKTEASSSIQESNTPEKMHSNHDDHNKTETIAPQSTTMRYKFEPGLDMMSSNDTFLDMRHEMANGVTELFKDKRVTPVQSQQATTYSQQTTSGVETTTEQILPTTVLPEIPSVVMSINENASISQESNYADKHAEQSWAPVSTIAPHSDEKLPETNSDNKPSFAVIEPPKPVELVPKPLQGFGLEDSTANLDTDIYQFAQLCNELAFGFWKSVTSGISQARSVIVSPFAATSLLAMIFLGARGGTSGEMNEILKLDDMVTFNPHLIFKNVSESIDAKHESGVAISAIIRTLYSDKSKGALLNFYKERARQFYDGHVEEVSFKEIGDVIRRRTNLLVKRQTGGRIPEFLRDNSIVVKSPLGAVSASIFQTDCSHASTDGRDGELHFVVTPTIRQRRLIPVPAVVYKRGFLAGYEPSLDATAVALGTKDTITSTIFIIPGQQGIAAPGDGLARLEKRLIESSFKKGAWSRLLRSLIPRPGLEVQIPRFSHRSVVNATVALKRMGLHDLFDPHKADLRGLNGVAHELHLSDMLQINQFATCGEERIADTHHSEIYPATAFRFARRRARLLENYHKDFTRYRSELLEEPRDYQRSFHDPLHDPRFLSLPLPLRPRQARIPEVPRLRFDRPFLYLIRHNPTGLILHMGRFNPRLLP